MKSYLVLIQARMGSFRLPGKSIRKLAGKPMIGHLLEGLESVIPRENIRVLSSLATENDALEIYLKACGIQILRGDEENVASRFAATLSAERPDFFLRISGDSPALDPAIAAAVIHKLKEGPERFVTTVLNKTFPSGMNVEGLATEAFLSAYPKFQLPAHYEHVTRYFYENPNSLRGVAVPGYSEDLKRYKFSVDTEQDFVFMEKFFAHLTRPHHEVSLKEKCAILEAMRHESNT